MAHDAFGLCALRRGGPIGWEEAASDVAVQAGVGPVGGATDEAVLDRVVMDVIDVVAVIGLVADQVLPISTLPDAAFAASLAYGRSMFGDGNLPAEILLDPPPTAREIAVSGRQGGDAMQVLGQDDPCIDPEASPSCGVHDGMLEKVQSPDQQVVAAPFQQVHGEEVCAARVPKTSVIGHVAGKWVGVSYRGWRCGSKVSEISDFLVGKPRCCGPDPAVCRLGHAFGA